MSFGFSRDRWYNYIADRSHPPVASAVVEKPEYDPDHVYAWKPANNYKGWELIARGEAGVDDASVIQSAIERSGAIYVRGGTYTLTTQLALDRSNTTLIGDRMGKTILKAGDGLETYQAILMNAPSTGMKNLTVDGNKTGGTALNRCVSFTADQTFLENVEIKNAPNHGVVIGTISRPRVQDCYMHDCSNWGLLASEPVGVIVSGNYFENHYTALECHSRRAVIYGNVIEHVSSAGIAIKGLNNVVVGNTIKNFDTPQAGMDAMYCHASKSVIANNVCINAGDTGIAIEWETPEVIIVGNYIEGAWYQGIYATSPKCIIKGNIVKNCGQSGTAAYGIRVGTGTSRADYNIIEENICHDDQDTPTQQYGIYGAGPDYCIIKNNILTPNGTGGIGGTFGTNCIQTDNIT